MIDEKSLSRYFVVAASLVIILAGIKLSAEIVVPFLLALFIAIICSPVIKFMTNHRVPHWLAIALLFVMILLLFFSLISLINSTVHEFTQSMPQYKLLMAERINDLKALAEKLKIPLNIDSTKLTQQFDPSSIMKLTSGLLVNFSNVVSNAFVLILVVIFMLLDAPTAKRKFTIAFSKNDREENSLEQHLDRALQGIISYLGVKTTVSLLTGLSVWVLLELADVQYAVLWATLSFLFNYIPNIGSITAAIPIVVQALLLNGFSVGFIVAFGVMTINMVVGNVIEPKMMGKKLGLSTLVVFLSLLFWGWLLGTVGMLLSVPLTMALKIALESSFRTARYAVLLGNLSEEEKTESN
ncbi:putative PurR-regulated permease PerM [Pasteurella langaaensis DSM 22999]|uniref:Putative PurR-regulated permease PerM n=1 Tax=Alitibacter langaaensis DSM 22999 TaxID=1122935 RepID=A0A2U0TGV3_9PAST|nr:AI-2E family transporter [Pasteurella langaaensis]PVX42817.1 putative PurR-regulated permease PerM [Pasteurella langaaensis DSM 22999]